MTPSISHFLIVACLLLSCTVHGNDPSPSQISLPAGAADSAQRRTTFLVEGIYGHGLNNDHTYFIEYHGMAGYFISKNVSLGLGFGVQNENGKNRVPLSLDMKAFSGSRDTYFAASAGYIIDSNRHRNSLFIHPAFGYQFSFDKNTALHFGLGVRIEQVSESKGEDIVGPSFFCFQAGVSF